MNVTELLDATTTIYRKGPEVEHRDSPVAAGVKVTEVWVDTPHADEAPDDEAHMIVDCHFLKVSVDMAAAQRLRDEFYALCDAWPPDATYQPENRLASGPSYIELGAQMGTFMGQQDAFRFMALGEALGVWTVITPHSLLGADLPDAEADRMAGGGFVMISGYRRGEVSA